MAAIAFTGAACGPSSAGSPPSPSIPAETVGDLPKPVFSSATSWKLQPSSAEHFYFTTSDTRLSLTDSSTTAGDAILTRAGFNLALSREPHSLLVSATVNSFSVEGGSRSGASGNSFPLPLSVVAQLQANSLTFTPAGSSTEIDCTNPAFTTLSVIQRALIVPPSDLRSGMTWKDSAATKLCSGGIPITTISQRSYRVLGEAIAGSMPVILLERQERSSSTGDGSSGQHRIAIQTEAVGSGQIAIDRLTGALVDDLSTYTVSITTRTSGRIQKFTQVVKEHTALKQ